MKQEDGGQVQTCLGEEVGRGAVEPAGLLVHEEGALLDEELQGGDSREDDHVGHHEHAAHVRLQGVGPVVQLAVEEGAQEHARDDERQHLWE